MGAYLGLAGIVERTIVELQRQLLNEKEFVTSAYGFMPSLRYPSLYEMGFDLRRGVKAEIVLGHVRDELQRLVKVGLTENEFERARNRIELDSLESLQTVQQRAHAMGFWEIVSQNCTFAEHRLAQYQSLDFDFILETAQRWWSPEALSWVIGRCGKNE